MNSNITEAVNPRRNLPTYFKAALLTVAASFLAFTVFWAIENIFWFTNITEMLLYRIPQVQAITGMNQLNLILLFTQEYSSAVGGFVGLVAGISAFLGTVLYVKGGPKYFARIRLALLFEAIFFLLLAPSSIHHLVGYAVLFDGNLYVGISYLIQVLLIVPPLLILSEKMKNPHNRSQILKWAAIAAPLITFGLWCKYLLLWVDTLVPLGSKEASVAASVGATNSVLTLLIASAVMTVGCYVVNQKKNYGKKLMATGVILVGAFFAIYSLVALSVPIYASFWYLTDIWMLTLPVLGIAILSYNQS
jgi:hypothetical protein